MNSITLRQTQTRLAYDDRGSGPVVVLLHAFPLDAAMWKPQFDELTTDFRLLAPSLPGFGDSDPVEGLSVDSAADIIADLLDQLGVEQPIVLGGLSMGGYVALAFARLYPQRLRGLILADTKAEPDDEAARANRDRQIRVVETDGAAKLVEEMLPKLIFAAGPNGASATGVARGIGTRQSAAGVMNGLKALRDRPDARSGLAHVTVPCLVIVGEHDAVTPPAKSAELTDALPNARMITIPAAGHLSSLENSTAFNVAVRTFLEPTSGV